MARISKNIAFTVPPVMAEEFDRIAIEEQSTKSELFRRMFRFYQSSRNAQKQRGNDFDLWVDRITFQAFEEKKANPLTSNELKALDEQLLRYGTEQAKALGINVQDEDVVNDIVYAERQAQRAKASSRS